MRVSLVLVAAVLVVACADPGDTATTVASVPPPSGTESPTTTHPVTPGTIPPFTAVEVSSVVGALGEHLVDAEGRSLYMFTLDDERTSTCEAACAGSWPPLLGDPVAAGAVDQALLGNAERSDGSIQVTYGGHPLYLYSGDSVPGDTHGHGFNEVWFLVLPGGDPLTR